MGLNAKTDVDTLRHIAERERAPIYFIGMTGDMQFTLENPVTRESHRLALTSFR
jgi:hypothetical protein